MDKFLICVDSDGCAMDTMTIKHEKCFGPCIIDVWGLEQWRDELQKRWEDINLYTQDRGINRFPGLAKLLAEVDEKYVKIPDLEDLQEWVASTKAYSEKALIAQLEKKPESQCLNKALQWSRAVNSGINALSDEEKVEFPGVAEGLTKAKKIGDVAIVSSANREAMEEEWERCGLMQYVDYSMAQDVGTKEACIKKMIAQGYPQEKILMIGDAMGDWKAAVGAGVQFYPILAAHEEGSWKKFRNRVAQEFVSGGYTKEREAEELRLFKKNLKAE